MLDRLALRPSLSWITTPLWRSVILVGLCLVMWLPGISSIPPFDRDEARFVQASKQMVQSGDYIDIYFQDQPRHKKPVGIYWLQSASVQLTGAVDKIWAYRVPSLLAGIIAVLATAAVGARLFTPGAGLLAGAILATTLLLGVESRMAKTDATLLASCMLALYGLIYAYWAARNGESVPKWVAAIFWAGISLGLIVKGPLVLLAIAGPLAFGSYKNHGLGWLKPLHPLWGLLATLAIVLPWVIAITLKTDGAFWGASVGQDLLAKVGSAQESHGAPPSYYLLTSLITFWPWTPLLVVVLWALRRELRHNEKLHLLLAWIIPFWLVFELIPTKLLHYTMPTFPALALILAYALTTTPALLSERQTRLGLRLMALLGITLNIALLGATVHFGGPVLAAITCALFALVLLVGLQVLKAHPRMTVTSGALALALTLILGFGHILPNLNPIWMSRTAHALIAPHRNLCPGPVASIGYLEPSLVFLLGTNTQLLDGKASLTAPTALPNSCQLVLWAHKPDENAEIMGEILGKADGFNYSKGKPQEIVLTKVTAQ